MNRTQMDPKFEEENVKAAANVFRGPSTEHRMIQPVYRAPYAHKRNII